MPRWTEQIRKRLAAEEPNVPWWVNDKYKLHRFCETHDIPTPELLKVWTGADDIDLSNLPERFVLKPSVMHSAWGVMVLERLPDGDTFFESLSGRTLTQQAIRLEQASVYERCKYKSEYRILIEEKIEDEQPQMNVPLDYKVFCFYDTPEFVQQINRNVQPKQLAWWDGSFNEIDLEASITSDWTHIAEGGHVVPSFSQEMLDVASRLTTLLGTPFMSVDMFATNRGPVVGELTPAPGAAYYGDWYKFTRFFDDKLGQAWEDAASRIQPRPAAG